MFKHLLIAIDGSEIADRALRQGLELAKTIGAKVTIINVTMPWASVAVGEVAVMFPPEEYDTNTAAASASLLERAKTTAAASGLSADTVTVSDPQPHTAILDVAKERAVDLIVMGSHGRRGIAGILLGSETVKTLTHGKIPVLVYRE